VKLAAVADRTQVPILGDPETGPFCEAQWSGSRGPCIEHVVSHDPAGLVRFLEDRAVRGVFEGVEPLDRGSEPLAAISGQVVGAGVVERCVRSLSTICAMPM
jgi:hypothetical protein